MRKKPVSAKEHGKPVGSRIWGDMSWQFTTLISQSGPWLLAGDHANNQRRNWRITQEAVSVVAIVKGGRIRIADCTIFG